MREIDRKRLEKQVLETVERHLRRRRLNEIREKEKEDSRDKAKMNQEPKKPTVQSLSERMNLREINDSQLIEDMKEFKHEVRQQQQQQQKDMKEIGTQLKKVSELGTQLKNVSDTLLTINNKLTSVESKLETVESKVEKSVEDVQKRVDAVEQRVTSCESATFKELYDIEAKRSNIVLFGLPEPERTGTIPPKEQDSKVVDEIFDFLTGGKQAFEIKFRIGQKQDGKTRPLSVNLRDIRSKDEIISKSSTLKEHPLWKNVYIQPDLTKKQQEYNRELEAQLKSTAESRNAELKNGEQWRWVLRGRGSQRHLAKSKIMG